MPLVAGSGPTVVASASGSEDAVVELAQDMRNIIGNSVKDTPSDPIVPRFLEDSNNLVRGVIELNGLYAAAAFTDARSALLELGKGVFPGALPDPPEPPTLVTRAVFTAQPQFGNSFPIEFLDSSVAPFTPAEITVPGTSDEIPVYVPVITGISVPDAPAAQSVTMPVVPTVDTEFSVPAAPAPDFGAFPDLSVFELPIYVPPVLPLFNEDAPTFDTQPPSPVIQWAEPAYSSEIQDRVKSVLEEMLDGGTGLPADVERAIWERGREREDDRSAHEIDAAIAQWTTRGFSFPPGQLNSQIIVLRDMTGRKVNELSREVMIKQADLEQKNRQFAVQSGIDYERVFTAIFLAITDRNFQIAKFAVESQIQIYNMLVTAFNVEQQVFAQQVIVFRTRLEAAFANIKAFEAQVGAVKAGADMNIALTQAFGEKVKAYATEVEAYNSTVKAETAKAELQKNKVELYKAQVDGAVAEIQGQREIFLAYDAKIRGETSKVGLEEANSRVYTARVQAIGEKARIIEKQVDAQIAKDRLLLDWNVANMQRITTLNAQQLNLRQSRVAGFEADSRRAGIQFEAEISVQRAALQAQIELSRLQVSKYETLSSQWKARITELVQMADISATSMRSAAQSASTLAAGALASSHVSAGISASGQASQTSSRAASDHTEHAERYDGNYSVTHSFAHKV